MYDLEPQQSVNVLVEFSATILGPDTATVIFNSNDPDEPSYEVQFFVNVKQPPILNVEPSEIVVELNSYENESSEIYISNSGEGELTYGLNAIVSETVY